MAIADVIKYDGNHDVFAWKYPNSEIGTWTQLIVHDSQEAVLFKGGRAFDVFSSGRHTLSTNNIPLLSKFINLPFKKKSPFSAEVWYVNRAHSLDIKWGTPSPIQIQDPKFGIMAPVRAFGQFGIQIEEAKKFLIKLVGTVPTFNKESLITFFRGLYLTKVKDSLSSYLINKKISILEINAYIDEISTVLKERIAPVMDEYGIKLVNFFVNDISVPEDDAAIVKLKDALSKRAEMNIIGYDYQQERSFDTLESAAKNNSSGGVMGAGMGIGMGVSMGAGLGTQFSGLVSKIDTSKKQECPSCKSMISGDVAFCPSCGVSTTAREQKEDSVQCGKCGFFFKKGSKFCPECGDRYQPCPKCGHDIQENGSSCPKCGFELPIPCPLCGERVDRNAKFCASCGGSLVKRCVKCNVELSPGKKFCPECGEKQ